MRGDQSQPTTFPVFRRIPFFLEENPNCSCDLPCVLSTRFLPYIHLLTFPCPVLPCLGFFPLFLVFEDSVPSQGLGSSQSGIVSKMKASSSLSQEHAQSWKRSWSSCLLSLITQLHVFSSYYLLHPQLATVIRKPIKCTAKPCGAALSRRLSAGDSLDSRVGSRLDQTIEEIGVSE